MRHLCEMDGPAGRQAYRHLHRGRRYRKAYRHLRGGKRYSQAQRPTENAKIPAATDVTIPVAK